MNHAATLDRLARYVLRPSHWDADTETSARMLPADTPEYHAGMLREEVSSGRAKVCDVTRDGEKVGFIVFSVTPESELVVMAAFGRDQRANLTAEIIALTDALARQCECHSVRFHTMRPGLIAKAQAHGFRISEIVMRKSIR